MAAPTIPESPARKRKKTAPTLSAKKVPPTPLPAPTPVPEAAADQEAEDFDDDIEEAPEPTNDELSLSAMLQNGQDEDYYDYDEY